MQNLIASLLLCIAACYLLGRWMPLDSKRRVYSWLSAKLPALSPYLQVESAGGCGSGCSSCGTGCSTPRGTSISDTPQIKPIQLVRKPLDLA
jgi:hypothetical protein